MHFSQANSEAICVPDYPVKYLLNGNLVPLSLIVAMVGNAPRKLLFSERHSRSERNLSKILIYNDFFGKSNRCVYLKVSS